MSALFIERKIRMVRISDIIRAEFAEGDNKRDAGLETPENIIRYDNIAY